MYLQEGLSMSTIEITRGERGFIVTGACVDIEFLILGMIQKILMRYYSNVGY